MSVTPNNATETMIKAMTERIVQQFDPLRIILFGPRARGNAGPWSDVDQHRIW